ncbi:MAG: hypothetical protein JXR51_03370 [Bacteroidales bacterium]|nr:hypothetical protein [Bacteroidales bacterium]
MRIVILSILFSLFLFLAKAQKFPVGIDSLDKSLNNFKTDIAKIIYLTDIALKIEWNKIELLPYLDSALKISKKINSGQLIAKSNSAIARIHYFNLDFDKTILYNKKAELFYKETNDYQPLIEIYRRIGRAYYYWGYIDLAIHQYKKSLSAAEKCKSIKDCTQLEREIGYNYLDLNEYEIAYKYFQKSLKSALKNNFESEIAYDYAEIGEYYLLTGKYEKSINYEKKSIAISKKIKNKHSENLASIFITESYLQIGQTDSAEIYCNHVLNNEIEKLKNDAFILAAKIYLAKNQLNKAIAYADSAYSFSSKMHNFNILKEVYIIYIKIYKKQNKHAKVDYYKEKLIKNYDSIIVYADNQKIKNIEILENIDDFENENIKLLEERKQKEFELKTSKQVNIAFSAILFLLIIIIIGAFYTLRKIKNKRNIILSQKIEIETQNQEIISQNENLNEQNEILTNTLNKLKEAQMQLIHSEKMASLGVLTAGIAHEINNPVNFIYTGVNSIQKDFIDIDVILKQYNNLDPKNQDIKERIKNIEKLKKKYSFNEAYQAISQTLQDIKIGAERTTEIVQGLRNFSRSEKGEWILADIHEGIEASLLLLKNKYKNRIEIIKNYDFNIPKIECLPGKLNQAFLNIINNAIDSILNKGKIYISTEKINNYIFVKIKDTGDGIEDEVKKHIFEPFYTTKEIGKGVGIGLSITYTIIKEHNGKINVNTEIGKGTEFLIQLPVIQHNK